MGGMESTPFRITPPFGDLCLIVAGTARGGTHYIANVLNAMGLRTVHEGFHPSLPRGFIKRGKNLVQDYICEVSGVNGYMLQDAKDAGVEIFHLWRHPVLVINSILRRWGGVDGESDKIRLAHWWMEKHQAIEKCEPIGAIHLHHPSVGIKSLYMRMGWYLNDEEERKLLRVLKEFKTPEGMCATTGGLPSSKEVTWKELPIEVRRFARTVGSFLPE